MKRKIASSISLLGILLQLVFPAACCAEEASADGTAAELTVGIAEIDQFGNIILTSPPEALEAAGFELKDIISVRIGSAESVMPIGTQYTDVDPGEPVCCYRDCSDGSREAALAINMGDLASTLGISDLSEPVLLSMLEKQGYAKEYALHHLDHPRTNDRGDYADLSDEEFANFRAAETSGMGKGVLFRSSSPVNPELNRNSEADEALKQAGIRTVMNMADSEEIMTAFPGYEKTAYSSCRVIPLNMDVDPLSEEYEQQLAEGFRFLALHEGPYLIHCLEGKDRTGFAVSILECLMGASLEEIIEDYMLTYSYFYGVEPGTPQYGELAENYLEGTLGAALGIPPQQAESADLSACAEDYLERIGLREEEIGLLREKLSEDHAGLNTAPEADMQENAA